MRQKNAIRKISEEMVERELRIRPQSQSNNWETDQKSQRNRQDFLLSRPVTPEGNQADREPGENWKQALQEGEKSAVSFWGCEI